MIRSLYYLFHSGKNSSLAYYIRNYIREFIPNILFRMRLKHWLDKLEQRPDKAYIMQRVDYYCPLSPKHTYDHQKWLQESVEIRQQKKSPQKVYYFDSKETARYFPDHLRWILLKGDITHVPDVPVFVKSRPLNTDVTNSTLLKMDKVRHFLFVNDTKTWSEKSDKAIFLGDIGYRKPNREVFMNLWFGHPMIDAGTTNLMAEHPEWRKKKRTISEHLDYKFIMSLEGNDVASNLKWIMSSNSIAVTPRLTCETWFMEGTLIPNYHYIEVKNDFSDLVERLQYYIDNPDEAKAIILHAHDYVAQFRDEEREKLIQLLVQKKYFEITNTEINENN